MISDFLKIFVWIELFMFKVVDFFFEIELKKVFGYLYFRKSYVKGTIDFNDVKIKIKSSDYFY